MELVGLGTAIVECLRIGRLLEQYGEAFLAQVYSLRETRECQTLRRSTEALAARWAAKEAVWKSLGAGWTRVSAWTDLEIYHENGLIRVELYGAPQELAQQLQVREIKVSLAHCRAYATATALALGR